MCRVNRLPELRIFLPIVPKKEWEGYQYELRLALREMLYGKWPDNGWYAGDGGVSGGEVVHKRLGSLASVPAEPAGRVG